MQGKVLCIYPVLSESCGATTYMCLSVSACVTNSKDPELEEANLPQVQHSES